MSSLHVWSNTDANCVTIQLDTVWLCRLAGYVRVYVFQSSVHHHLWFSTLYSWRRQAASADRRQETVICQNTALASRPLVRLTPTPKMAFPATVEKDTATMDSVLPDRNTARDFGDQVEHQWRFRCTLYLIHQKSLVCSHFVFVLFHLDAEVAADACFNQNGNCRKMLFSQRCSNRYVMKSQNSSVIA